MSFAKHAEKVLANVNVIRLYLQTPPQQQSVVN